MGRRKKLNIVMFSLGLLLVITGCAPTPEFELYDGEDLRIAVVGDEPEVREDHIALEEISFEDFTAIGL